MAMKLLQVSAAYNFTTSGEGLYNIEASNKFFLVDPATLKVSKITAKQESAYQTKLSGTLSRVARRTSLTKRVGFNGCDNDRQSLINNAIPAARDYANGARE
jgi:peptidyl-Lys metalloendopeptidase